MYVTVQRGENHYTDLLLNCNRIDVENEQLVVMFLKRSHIDHSQRLSENDSFMHNILVGQFRDSAIIWNNRTYTSCCWSRFKQIKILIREHGRVWWRMSVDAGFFNFHPSVEPNFQVHGSCLCRVCRRRKGKELLLEIKSLPKPKLNLSFNLHNHLYKKGWLLFLLNLSHRT